MRRSLPYFGLITASVLAATGALGQEPRLLGLRTGTTGDTTRIVLDLSAPADLLIAPAQEGRGLHLLALAAGPSALPPGHTASAIESIRYLPLAGESSSVALSFLQPMAVKAVMLLTPEAGAGYRAVFDMAPAEPAARRPVGIPWASDPRAAKPDMASLQGVAKDQADALARVLTRVDQEPGQESAWRQLAQTAQLLGDAATARVATEHAQTLAALDRTPATMAVPAPPETPRPARSSADVHARTVTSAMRRQLASANPQMAAGEPRVGVAGAVNPATTGIAPGADGGQILQIGNDILFRERIVTDAGGQTQILFLDHSALSVGPNADLTIDEFVYNPETSTGHLAMTASVGVFRYVGGKLSKSGEVAIKTPVATIGVRGGIAYISVESSGRTQATLGFGAQLTVTGLNGATQTIAKPGFGVTVEAPPQGAAPAAAPPPSAPTKALPAALASMVQSVEATAGNPVNAPLAVTKTTIEERLAPPPASNSAPPTLVAPSAVLARAAETQTNAAPSVATPPVAISQITANIERSVQTQAAATTERTIAATPAPTAPPRPTVAPTPAPTAAPTPPPTAAPIPAPTAAPTPAPTPLPTAAPTPPPTQAPLPHITTPTVPTIPSLPNKPSGP